MTETLSADTTPAPSTRPVPGAADPPGGSPGRHGPIAVVVPTVGRPSLAVLCDALLHELTTVDGGIAGPTGIPVVIVDDRPGRPLPVPGIDRSDRAGTGPTVVRSGGRGPAAARNVGWRTALADAAAAGRPAPEWIVFLDDDVLVGPGWGAALVADLRAVPADVGAVQGRLSVPLPAERRPTDWERGTAALTDGSWLTADIAYRSTALRAVAGFDERFPRAFREDADLAHRVAAAGWRLTRGHRRTVHPVRPVGAWVSVRTQAGNADDALLRARYGRTWRRRLDAGPGRTGAHAATVAAGALALAAGAARRPRLAAVAGAAWAGLTADFARRRIVPGPRPGEPGWATEACLMAVTSTVIPFAAVRHRLAGSWCHRGAPAWPPSIRAVLFDRDGTLVHDVAYNGDPEQVRLVQGAAEAVARVRNAGLAVGLVTNQSGVARGLLRPEQVAAVNRRVAELIGGVDTVQVCPHGPGDDGNPTCGCRKPEPGLVLRAAAALRVRPAECVVIGDIGADVRAAVAAGAAGVLVPTPVTRAEEVTASEWVADNFAGAVDLVLDGIVRRPLDGSHGAPVTASSGRP